MGHAIAIGLWVLALSAGLVTMAWVMSCQLAPEAGRPQVLRWLLRWSFKGLIVPVTLWAIMNWGVSWSLQPFMPQIQAAQSRGGTWLPEFLQVLATGLFIICSYWTATTLGWRLLLTSRSLEAESRANLKGLGWTCLIGMGVPAGIVLLVGGWPTLGLSALAVLAPMAGYAPKLLRPRKLPPMYARAVARMKFGKYAEAEWEIIRELEKCEDDFEG
ncbi:MAG TPA: hypothetical protein VNT26_13550, partial [Candidatus Sulfotelmatobacter sp.]|nr:hypothetical protein [Candidatus Sulfotelmatobacter sp.]